MIEISLDDTSTWPAELLVHFERHENLLRAYEAYERKLGDDSAWGPDYVPTAHRPANPLSGEKRHFLSSLCAQFSDKLVLRGFHCTRLTDDEVAKIRVEGMTPPDIAMLRRRIEAIANAGLITAQTAGRLVQENYASDPYRAGRIWFVFTKALLRRESGVHRLFRYWGGEALYAQHDRDPEMGPILASIGMARIVEASVSMSDMGPMAFPDKQIVLQFLAARGVPVLGSDYECRAVLPLPADHIRRVISQREDAFESLTGCAEWRPPLS